MQIIAYVIATLIPLIALYIIYTLDLYKTGAFKYVLSCFGWGILAFAAAFFLNRTLYNMGFVTRDILVRFEAPFAEEILKSLLLFYLVRLASFTYFVDGAIYGFAAGIGFAIVENYSYINASAGAEFSVAVGRVLSTNLIHATCSAIIGIAFGLSRFQRSWKKVGLILLGYVVAITFHTIFNNLVDRVSSSLLLLYAAIFGFSGAGIIAFAMQRGLNEEKAWIEEKLGMADRVTAGEAAIVKRFGEMDDLLTPLTERFGEEKAEKIQQFLTTQAKLGIQRKTLDKLTDPKMRAAVEKQMEELRIQMDGARRDVGAYAMLYLRHTIPPDTSPVWGRLETLIQERAAARPATGGMNIYTNLQQRAQKTDENGQPIKPGPAVNPFLKIPNKTTPPEEPKPPSSN